MRFDESPEEEAGARPLRVRAMVGRLLPLFRPHRRAIAAGAGLLALAVGADIALPLVLRHLVDTDIPSRSSAAIFGQAGLFLCLFLVSRAAAYVQVSILARM